jgi:hypothetical protein
MFESINAVENFDRVERTLEDTIQTETDPKWVCRQLDDVYYVRPSQAIPGVL